MFNNIPLSEQEGMYIFPGGSGTTTWIQWTKPPGIKFVYTMCVGGGAGGSGGVTGTAGTARTGGGGGGSAVTTIAMYNSALIPDVL